jgi:hypothetical protein
MIDQNLKKELDSLKTAIASAESKYKEIKANPADHKSMDDCLANMDAKMNYLFQEVSYIYNYASRVENALYNVMATHKENHLPPVIGPEKMAKAIKALGLDGDYEVFKRPIFASKDKVVVNYTTPLK